MKSATEYLTFNTERKREYINITGDVARVVRRAASRRAWCW